MSIKIEKIPSAEMVGHECALVGITLQKPQQRIYPILFSGIDALNHRGEEAAGMAWLEQGVVKSEKQMGLRETALPYDLIATLPSTQIAMGHTRYSTTGKPNLVNAQPFVFNDGAFAIAHNGNVHWDVRPEQGEPTSDTYGIGKQIAFGSADLQKNMVNTLSQLNGAYTFLFMTKEGLYAARDPWGFRPLVGGKLNNGLEGFVVSSESAGTNKMHATQLQEIPRGTLVQIHSAGFQILWEDPRVKEIPESACSFEKTYFADATSAEVKANDRRTNHELRSELGRRLYERIRPKGNFITAVPNSGRSYAEGVSLASGIPLAQAIQTNRYVGRNFLKPQTPAERMEAAFKKYNFVPELIDGNSLIVVDDSVVRGPTLSGLILNLFQLGAKDLELLIGIPPIKHPCYWGIDFQDSRTLIYNILMGNGDQEQFESLLTDWLVGGDKTIAKKLRISFQTLEDYVAITKNVPQGTSIHESGGCFHCVSGQVPLGAHTDVNMSKERFDAV